MMMCSPVARGDASRWAACSLMPSPVPCCSRGLLRRRCWERHAEDGAAHAVTLAIECLDAATMLLDNAARHGEAEAGTGLGRLRRDEGIEDDLQHVLLYAARVVLDIDDDTACGARRDVEPELRAIAAAQRLQCVEQQVDEHLVQQVRISIYRDVNPAGPLYLHAVRADLCGEKLEQVVEQSRDRHALHARLPPPCIVEHVAHDVRDTLDLRTDDAQLPLRTGPLPALQHALGAA